jgi:hypothetical protein
MLQVHRNYYVDKYYVSEFSCGVDNPNNLPLQFRRTLCSLYEKSPLPVVDIS